MEMGLNILSKSLLFVSQLTWSMLEFDDREGLVAPLKISPGKTQSETTQECFPVFMCSDKM